MKIAAISGSPRGKASVSQKMINQLARISGEKIETCEAIKLVNGVTPDKHLNTLLTADILLIVFPLYVDSLPSPLIELLTRLEQAAAKMAVKPRIYAISNCGFYDSSQIATALKMVEHFAGRSGCPWGYGLGISGGGMFAGIKEDSWEKGPGAGVYQALKDMAASFDSGKSADNVFLNPPFPRFLYKKIGDFSFWLEGKKNHVKNMRVRPYSEN